MSTRKCLTAVQRGLKIASTIEFDFPGGVHLGKIGIMDSVGWVRGRSPHRGREVTASLKVPR
jgi:hypothetical protein